MDTRNIPLLLILLGPVLLAYCFYKIYHDGNKCESKPGQVYVHGQCIKGERVKL